MSLILDALNRSDSDRAEPGASSGLQTNHGPLPAPDAAWKRYVWPLIALLLLIAAVLPWLLGRQQGPPAVQEPDPSLQPAGTATVRPAPSTPVASSVVATPVADPRVAALYQSSAVAPGPEGTPASGIAPVEAPTMPLGVVNRPSAKPEPGAKTRLAPQPESVLDVDAVAAAAEQALAERKLREPGILEHAAPDISELSQREKNLIPSIFYNSHFWATNPRERRVVLNGRTYHQGDQVKPGLKLVQILENSIVLTFQGEEFQLRALSSWVNL